MKITNSMHRHKLIPDDPHMGLWSYAYDALPLQGASRANLTRQADARGQRICLYYDGLNRLTGKHYRQDDSCPASPTLNVAYGYDAVCQRTSMTDASGSTSWSYTAAACWRRRPKPSPAQVPLPLNTPTPGNFA